MEQNKMSNSWRRIEDSALFKGIKSAHELIIIAIFYLAFFGGQFNRPDVEVTYSIDVIDPPLKLSSAVEGVPSNSDTDSPLESAQALISSRNILRIEIRNNSTKRVDDFELTASSVLNVADVSLSSTSRKLYAERRSLTQYDLNDRGELTFPKLSTLPPSSSTRILVWGTIPPSYFLDYIEAIGSAEGISVKQRQEATGIGLFIAQHIKALTVLLIAYLATIACLRYRRKSGASVNS